VGATVEADGVNFCVYSKHASSVELLLFADAAPAEVIRLDPDTHRTYHWWYVLVRGVKAGQVHGYLLHPGRGRPQSATSTTPAPATRCRGAPASHGTASG
jgi:isoamylase